MHSIKLNASLIINIWDNCSNPIAVVQLIHGAMEHSIRYNDFGKFLNTQNIIFVAYDLPGHGINLQNQIHHVNSKDEIINSCVEVNNYINSNYKLPLIILGHSMGSIIVRNLILNNNIKYDKVILSGTVNPPKLKVISGLYLQKLINIFSKKENSNKLSNFLTFKIFAKMSAKKYGTRNWLTSDLVEYKKYLNDDLCNNPFSNNFIYELLKLTKISISKSNLNSLANTNFLIISGEEDPCSNFSNDINKLGHTLSEINNKKNDNNIIIFSNMKHEILNEKEKYKVYTKIIEFIECT